jgi:ribonuclease HI
MIDKSYAKGYFNGANQANLGPYGVVSMLYLPGGERFSFKQSLGWGTNNWATIIQNLKNIKFMDDSKLVIEQVQGSYRLQTPPRADSKCNIHFLCKKFQASLLSI